MLCSGLVDKYGIEYGVWIKMERLIYLLDDNIEDQVQFREWVDGFHVTLRGYMSAESLLEGVRDEIPNVILTADFDIELDGIKDIPIIAISRENTAIIRLHATKVQASAFYVLPPNISHLLNTIDGYGTMKNNVRGNILVAGFNPERNRAHALALHEFGLSVSCAVTAEGALLLAMSNPDFIGILTDYKLGSEESGLRLIQAIRGIMNYSHIPAVLLTDTLKVEERTLCMKLGGVTVVPRYIDPKLLAEGVHYRVLEGVMAEHTI